MSGVIDLTGDEETQSPSSPIDLESDDEDLKMAIAMSLQSQHNSPGLKSTTIDTRADRFNTSDVKQAIALPLQSRVVVADSSQKHDEPEQKAALPPAQALVGILGLNRKAMEAERLARLKRKRGMDGQSPSPPSRRISPPPLRRAAAASASANSRQPFTTTGVPSDNPFSFPNPRVLLTSHPSRHSSSGLEAISFRDVVSPPSSNYSLKSVLASSFIVDFDWLLPHFNTATTKFIFVLHAQNDQHRRLLQQDFAGVPNVRLVMPEHLGGGGNMHSKIMLLFFKDDSSEISEEICRVVVPSANLTPADWGVGGVMENVAFVVDLPSQKATSIAQIETQFKKEVQKQIRAMDVPEDVLRKLENFNFSATRNVGFVHSMSGSRALQASSTSLPDKKNFFGTSMTSTKLSHGASDPQVLDQAQGSASIVQDDPARTGLLSLQDTIHSLGLSSTPTDPSYPPRLDFITSSLGNLSTPFVRQLYQAACAQLDPTVTASATAPKRGKSGSNNDDANLDELIKKNLRIYFPSDETVKKSKGGPNAAGTICFQKKWWETNDLVRDVLCDCVGVRDDGILMHNKVRAAPVSPFVFCHTCWAACYLSICAFCIRCIAYGRPFQFLAMAYPPAFSTSSCGW